MSLPNYLNPKPNPDIYRSDNWVVLDFETSSLEKGNALNADNHLLMSAWYRSWDDSYHYIWGDEYAQDKLLEDLRNADFIVAHNCFSGDTRFVTSEGIKSLAECAGRRVKVWTEKGWKWGKVRCYGKSDTLRVTLAPYNRSRSSILREVVATPNHRWKVDRWYNTNRYGSFRKEAPGYVTTEELKVGDKIWAERPDVEITPDSEGFRHGLIFADGSRHKTRPNYAHCLRLCGWKEMYKDIFPKYTYPPSAPGDPVVNYYVSDRNMKALPDEEESLEYKANFIEGWQLFDGTDSGNGTSRTVTTMDREAAEWLRNNAICGGWYVTGYSYYFLETGFRKDVKRWVYYVTLTKNPDMGWTVRSVEEDSPQKVYCVEVEGIDRFTLDHGIYTGNCKFESHWAKRCGLAYGERLAFDTMLADYVFAGNRRMPFDLGSCCERHGLPGKEGLVGSLMKAGVPIESLPKEWIQKYCLQDIRATKDLFLRQREKMLSTGMYKILFTRCILTPVLAAIEANGMQLDCERVNEMHDEYATRLAEIEGRLAELMGEVNLGSPQQLAGALYEDLKFKEPRKYGKPDRNVPNKAFPEGQPKTDMATIQSLKATNKKQREVQELLIEQSKTSAMLTKNLKVFKALCEQHGGKLYGEIRQTTTRTHRTSSSGRPQALEIEGKVEEKKCQLQNIPRAAKRLFRSRGDRYVVECDYASLEWRAAGILGNDSQIREDVINLVDVHQNCMDVLNKAGEGLKERFEAKAHSFRPQYSEPMPKKKPEPTDEYAQWYKERYSELAETQRKWARSALRDKRIKTPWGLIYYFPYARMTQSGYIKETNSIYNYPIQGFAGAEIMGPALVYLYWYTVGTERAILTNSVHDSIEAEVEPDALEWYAQTAAKAMLDATYNYLREVYGMEVGVPLGIGITPGSHWGEGGLQPEQICGIVNKLRESGYGNAVADGDEVKITYA